MTSTGAAVPRRRAPIAAADPAVFVGFGATGDLTRRKLLPALVNLRRSGALSDRFAFLGIVRQPEMVASFAGDVLAATAEFLDTPLSDDEHRWFAERIVAVAGDLEQPDLYTAIATTLREVQSRVDTGGNALFYLATWILSIFNVNVPLVTGVGTGALVFSIVVVIIAAMNLLLDFSVIENGIRSGAPRSLSWFAAFGLMVTIIWLYIEILRLIAIVLARRQ